MSNCARTAQSTMLYYVSRTDLEYHQSSHRNLRPPQYQCHSRLPNGQRASLQGTWGCYGTIVSYRLNVTHAGTLSLVSIDNLRRFSLSVPVVVNSEMSSFLFDRNDVMDNVMLAVRPWPWRTASFTGAMISCLLCHLWWIYQCESLLWSQFCSELGQ